jgi:hypothetical protein
MKSPALLFGILSPKKLVSTAKTGSKTGFGPHFKADFCNRLGLLRPELKFGVHLNPADGTTCLRDVLGYITNKI